MDTTCGSNQYHKLVTQLGNESKAHTPQCIVRTDSRYLIGKKRMYQGYRWLGTWGKKKCKFRYIALILLFFFFPNCAINCRREWLTWNFDLVNVRDAWNHALSWCVDTWSESSFESINFLHSLFFHMILAKATFIVSFWNKGNIPVTARNRVGFGDSVTFTRSLLSHSHLPRTINSVRANPLLSGAILLGVYILFHQARNP